MTMIFYKNPKTNEVYGYDSSDSSQASYIEAAIQNGWVDITGNWPIPPTDSEKKAFCKANAAALIATTDWAVLPDVGLKNSADFVTYRGILRGLIISPVADPVWPTEPTPIWS